jgi:hypothetical protein
LPDFFKDYLKNLNEGVLVLVGQYYLGEKYDLSLLESLPISKILYLIKFNLIIVEIFKVKEKIVIDGKEKDFPKVLLVSDIFFCLFDQEKWTKNNLHLTFWTNIRALATIKKTMNGDSVRFFWKQKNKKVKSIL